MSTSNFPQAKTRGAYQIIQTHSQALAPYYYHDGPKRAKTQYDGALRALHHHGILKKAERVRESGGKSTITYYLWQINPIYEQLVGEVLEAQAHLPCGTGHTGWRCVEAGKRYECSECGAEYGRDAVERLEEKR